MLHFASKYAASSVSSFTTWTCSPQKRCVGTDFARWPIVARSSCRLIVGFVIPRCLASCCRMPPVGLLRSAGITPLRCYYKPVRQALVFTALRLSARTTTLLPRVFSAGRGALLCFHPCPCTRAAALYPAERRAPQIDVGSAYCLRRNCAGSAFGSSADEASSGRSRVVAARVLAHPAHRGFVGGLRRRDLPRRRHPSYAASICYRLRTFTLRIHGYLQASHD